MYSIKASCVGFVNFIDPNTVGISATGCLIQCYPQLPLIKISVKIYPDSRPIGTRPTETCDPEEDTTLQLAVFVLWALIFNHSQDHQIVAYLPKPPPRVPNMSKWNVNLHVCEP